MRKLDIPRVTDLRPGQEAALEDLRKRLAKQFGITLAEESGTMVLRWSNGARHCEAVFDILEIDDGSREHTHCDGCGYRFDSQSAVHVVKQKQITPQCVPPANERVKELALCYDCYCPK